MSGQSKLKTLYVMRLLFEESSEEKVLSASDICSLLSERYGVVAERKGIYSDIEVLKEFGLDIRQQKGSNPGYYLVKDDAAAVFAVAPKAQGKDSELPKAEKSKEITVDIPFKQPEPVKNAKSEKKDMSDVGSISYLVKDKNGESAYALKVNTASHPYKVKVKDYKKDADREPTVKRLDANAVAELRELCFKLEKI